MALANGTAPSTETVSEVDPAMMQADLQEQPQGPVCIHPETGVTDGVNWDEEKEKSIITDLTDLYHAYRDCSQRQAVEEWWEWCWRAYMAYRRSNSRFEFNLRECFKQLEVWKANVYELIFGSDEWFHFKPRTEGGQDMAEGSTACLHDAIKRGGSSEQFRQFIENMGMFGIAYMHPHWRMFRRTECKRDQAFADFEKDEWERTTSEVKFELPFAECISPRDVYSHPGIQDCRQSPAVFIRKYASPADLKTMVREGILDGQRVMDAIMECSGQNIDIKNKYRGIWDEDAFDQYTSHSTKYDFLVAYTFDGYEFAILNETHLLRAMPTDDGTIPIRNVINYPQDKIHYGVPELMLIVEGQRMLNLSAEAWFTSNWYTGSPMFKIKHGSRAQQDQTPVEPGARFYVDAMDDMDVLQVPPTQVVFEQAMNFIRNDMQLTTGLSDQLAGTSSNANTATEFSGLQQNATKRINYKVVICRSPLEDICRMMYNLMARHQNENYVIRIVGVDGKESFKDYPPSIFTPDIDVEWQFGPAGGPEQARLWMEVLKLTMGNPLVNQQPILDRLFRALGEKNVRVFRANRMNQQGDALKQIQEFMITGLLPDVSPADDPMVFFGIFNMFMQSDSFRNMPDPMQQIFSARVGEYQSKVQMMMQMQAQAAMAQTAEPAQKQLPVGKQADDRTEGTFNNAGRGAMQNAKNPGTEA